MLQQTQPNKIIHLNAQEIIKKVNEFECKNVLFTGGEPLLQANIFPLISTFCDLGYNLAIETNGSLDCSTIDQRAKRIIDVKCPDSGMAERNYWANLENPLPNTEFKFVIASYADYDFAKKITEKYSLVSKSEAVLFSPVSSLLEPKKLAEWILNDKLNVVMQLQLHKIIWGMNSSGV